MRASQKRSNEYRPLGGKENYDRVDFTDRLQNNSMLLFHATKGNQLVPSMLAAGANRKNVLLRIFYKLICCNSNRPYIPPAFLLFYSLLDPTFNTTKS